MPRVALRNFTGGEVTPTLSARYDLKKFGSFLQVCRNFIPNLHGDIERRPGFRWVDTLPNDRTTGSPSGAVLIPFMYNTEVENNYVLLFRFDGLIDIAGVKCGADGKAIHPIEYVPLGTAEMHHNYVPPKELYELSYAQVADVLYIAHPNHALSKVTRSGAFPYVWNFESVSINKSLPKPVGLEAKWVSGNGEDTVEPDYDLYYVVSAVDAEGVESLPSDPGITKGKYATDWVVGNHVDLSWNPVPGADHYRVYRVAAGYYGLIAVVEQPDEGFVSFQDNNIEADVSISPKEDWNPFLEKDENGNDKVNNPATICFHNQRMWLGGGSLHPATLYASRTGDFESFRKSLPLQDDDPLEFMLASGSVDDIKWLSSFDNLLIGTAGSEYKASASGGAITPSDCHVTAQSYWGSSGLQPLLIGQSILHAQRANQHVRDLYYTWESDSYTGNDLSLLAPQLVEGHDLYQWCFQQSPGSCLWIVRSDGVLLCLTYMKEQNVFGWSVHELGDNGKAISVAVINGEREDVVFAVVQRGDIYTLERLERRFSDEDGIEDSFYLDCARTFEGNGLTSISGTETFTQSWLTAEVVTSSESEPYEPPAPPTPPDDNDADADADADADSDADSDADADADADSDADTGDYYIQHDLAFELSYAEVVAFLSSSAASSLSAGDGYVAYTATRPARRVNGYNYDFYANGGTGPSGNMSSWGFMGRLATQCTVDDSDLTLVLDNALELERNSAVGSFARIGGEIMKVTGTTISSVSSSRMIVFVVRGCADTFPETHSSGSEVWFYQSGVVVDATPRAAGTRMIFDVEPTINGDDAGTMTRKSISVTGRASRPYPPAGVKIQDQWRPSSARGEVTISWVGRDRAALGSSLVGFYDRSVNATESDVTYQYKLWHTYTGPSNPVTLAIGTTSGTSVTVGPFSLNVGHVGVYFELWAVKDGVESAHFQHSFTYWRT